MVTKGGIWLYSVKDIRKAKRIKANEMARDLNITRQRLYLIENKAISISAELKHKIAVYLGFKPIDIKWWYKIAAKVHCKNTNILNL